MRLRRTHAKRSAVVGACALALSWNVGRAQQPAPTLAVCDSIVAAARVDSVEAGLFVSIARIDGGWLADADAQSIVRAIGSAFIAPRPFRMSVFAGPARTRLLRPRGGDTIPELQAPTVTGVYRVFATKRGSVSGMQVVRSSLMPGFDSAASEAIGTTASFGALVPKTGEDSMRAEVRFSTDSSLGARRIISASFPRMRVVSAVPLRDNPAPAFPDEEKGDSTLTGEVVFRFVVDRDGSPAMETVEVVRGTSLSFVKTALAVLPKQLFAPATIGGCAVSQRVEFPFTFVAPPVELERSALRH
jgi:hypothetical protein